MRKFKNYTKLVWLKSWFSVPLSLCLSSFWSPNCFECSFLLRVTVVETIILYMYNNAILRAKCLHTSGADITITFNIAVRSPINLPMKPKHNYVYVLTVLFSCPLWSLHGGCSGPRESCNCSLFRHSSLIINYSFCLLWPQTNTETLRSCWQAQSSLPV